MAEGQKWTRYAVNGAHVFTALLTLECGGRVEAFESAARPQATSADVVVYGGTPSGVMAALAAARNGSSVMLVEPSQHLGGMCSGGLSVADFREPQNIGGYAREFFSRTLEYYGRTYGAASDQYDTAFGGMKFEPHVAEDTFKDMIGQSAISVVYGATLAVVRKTGTTIDSLVTSDGRVLAGKVFVDASYEGDLMAASGVAYVVGREARTQYNERFGGVQGSVSAWPASVSASSPTETLLPFIQAGSLGTAGSADNKIEAYGYRLCLTQRPDIFREMSMPDGYDESSYEVLGRYLDAKPETKLADLFAIAKIPNGKADVNSAGLFSTDMIGASWDYPNASPAERGEIERAHRNYTQGLFYYLAHSTRVPLALRSEAASYGLAKDEFVDNDNWPYQLYIREARRMVGQYVMSEKNAMTETLQPDVVGVASYIFDSHPVQRLVLPSGQIVNEGTLLGYVAKPFTIPYRSILPSRLEADNLLVSVAISASHVLYGAYRMEAYYMHIGQAAGAAASLAVSHGLKTSDVPASDIQSLLSAQGALLTPAPAAN